MEWSKYQEAVFEAVRGTDKSLVIEAVAGSGKTSTIVEAVKHVPAGKRVCFLAFNKAIAETLGERMPQNTCMTLHALGFRAWRAFAGQVKVDGRKSWDVLKELVPDWETRKAMGGVVKLVGLAKQAGIVPGGDMRLRGEFVLPPYHAGAADASRAGSSPSNGGSIDVSDLPDSSDYCDLVGLAPDTDDHWHSLAAEYDVDPDEYDVDLCRRVLRASLASCQQVIDYDDMLYLPVVAGAPFDRYDVVFVDEWQDTNAIQHVMVQRLVNGGRLIAVGDASQSIYRFRGALGNCMEIAREAFGCVPLPLSISYRCPVKVIEHVRQWVPQIEWREGAEAGTVAHYPKWPMKDFTSSDVVLCRLTRPLVALAFRLIRAQIACHILGRDIASGLTHLIDKSKIAPGSPISAFDRWLTSYHHREEARLLEKHQHAQAGVLGDKVATVRVFMANVTTVFELRKSIESLFADGRGGITLSTIHKFKGQEAPRVFVLDADTLMPCPWSSDVAGEQNLMYVAATRAQRDLVYVRSDDIA